MKTEKLRHFSFEKQTKGEVIFRQDYRVLSFSFGPAAAKLLSICPFLFPFPRRSPPGSRYPRPGTQSNVEKEKRAQKKKTGQAVPAEPEALPDV
jgi:hypothetical protein